MEANIIGYRFVLSSYTNKPETHIEYRNILVLLSFDTLVEEYSKHTVYSMILFYSMRPAWQWDWNIIVFHTEKERGWNGYTVF